MIVAQAPRSGQNILQTACTPIVHCDVKLHINNLFDAIRHEVQMCKTYLLILVPPFELLIKIVTF